MMINVLLVSITPLTVLSEVNDWNKNRPYTSLRLQRTKDFRKSVMLLFLWQHWILPNIRPLGYNFTCNFVYINYLTKCGSWRVTRNSSGEEIANVNFLYDDIVMHYKIQ